MARILNGRVVSTKMDKTAVVVVNRLKKHPIYGKKYKVSKKYFAHDPDNKAIVGQLAEITESRPISKNKRWVVSKLTDSGSKQ